MEVKSIEGLVCIAWFRSSNRYLTKVSGVNDRAKEAFFHAEHVKCGIIL
jgi:hypothetical protein